MKDKKHKTFENYKKIRKPMPPPTRVIQHKHKSNSFDWRKEINNDTKGEL